MQILTPNPRPLNTHTERKKTERRRENQKSFEHVWQASSLSTRLGLGIAFQTYNLQVKIKQNQKTNLEASSFSQ